MPSSHFHSQSIISTIDQVAGIPPRTSYIWGGRLTPLPFAAFWTVTLVRALSPLQWIKFVYRKRGRTRNTTNLRRDFPSSFTEWYYIALGAISLAALLIDPQLPTWVSQTFRILGWWVIVDCGVWIIYYLFLRYFIEGKFSAYHSIEYLLQFPLVASVQCMVIALVAGLPLTAVIDGLRGSNGPEGLAGSLLGWLGVVYIGGALGILISSLPPIDARGADSFAIVGVGDLAIRRLLPALSAIGVRPTEINLLDTEKRTVPGYRVFQDSSAGLRTRLVRSRVPTIIATPTDSHLEYAATLSRLGVRFAIEKPICAGKADRLSIQRNMEMYENAFALSYYALEKALPLNYLLTQRDAYLPYLEDCGGGSISQAEVRRAVDRLGTLESVDIRLLEGPERSPSGSSRGWTEKPENGISALIETVIHPLHLLCLFVPDESPLELESLNVARFGPRDDEVRAATGTGIAPTFIDFSGKIDDAFVRIVVGKHIPEKDTERVLEARFSNGRVVCRFDERDVRVFIDVQHDSDGAALAIRVPEKLIPYEVQISLFRDFVNHGWRQARFDDIERQLRALTYWEQLVVAADGIDVSRYDDQTSVHPAKLVR